MKNEKRVPSNLKAFTIVESMVAMFLIVLSFGTAMMIFMQVVSGNRLEAKASANILLNHVLEDTKRQNRYLNESIELGGLLIEKEVSNYPLHKNTYLISLKAISPDNHILSELKEVLYLPLQ